MSTPGISTVLPLHPTMRHPRTGEPLRALYVSRHGRPFWPLIGASPDEGGEGGGAGGAGGGEGAGGGDGSGAGAGGEGAGSGGDAAGGAGKDDPGFPANTPVAEMTLAQQAAYHQHQSRKHEQRAKAYREAAGGKSADEVKSIVETAEQQRRNTLTLDEKTLEDAREQARKAALADTAPKAVKAAFDLLLGDMPEAEKTEVIELLDLKKFLTDDNEVDTAKVRAHVARINPDKGRGQGRDYGQGRRGGSPAGGSVAAVMAERRAAREKK